MRAPVAQELLVDEQIDAGAEFVRDFSEYLPVRAAFWVNPAESEDWFLYIASDEIDDGNRAAAYREVLRRLHEQPQWLDPFRVKLVSSSDPVARQVVEIRDRYPAKIPTRYHGSSLGGMSIGAACIYPPLPAMKSMPQ